MNRLLIVGILIGSAVPLFAQAQQPNVAKLKEDAQKVIRIIRGDKAKTQAYCQIYSLGGQINQAAQQRDRKKTEALTKTAGIFWLKHHKPDEYRGVQEHKHTGELKSSETLRLEFLAEAKALMNEGLLSEAGAGAQTARPHGQRPLLVGLIAAPASVSTVATCWLA
jgi:hypothetical protein